MAVKTARSKLNLTSILCCYLLLPGQLLGHTRASKSAYLLNYSPFCFLPSTPVFPFLYTDRSLKAEAKYYRKDFRFGKGLWNEQYIIFFHFETFSLFISTAEVDLAVTSYWAHPSFCWFFSVCWMIVVFFFKFLFRFLVLLFHLLVGCSFAGLPSTVSSGGNSYCYSYVNRYFL
jgi:hypothetical protein